MKLNGKKIEGPNTTYIVIPRPDGDLVFKAVAILDYKPFNDLCPRPTPPKIMVPGGGLTEDKRDQNYLAALDNIGKLRYYFVILYSLKATEGLEWEKVQLSDPSTWKMVEEELTSAGFTEREQQYMFMKCMELNALTEDKLEEARHRFLLTLAVQQGMSASQQEEPLNTQSGVPASA